MASHVAVPNMQTPMVAQRCAEETQRYFNREPYDEAFCFELFRRALAQNADDAWQLLYAQYRALTAGWVQGHSLFPTSEEDADYFINEAFFRLARACTPEKFPRFKHVAQLLNYLKACVHGAITDHYERRVANVPDGVLVDEVAGEPVSRPLQSKVMEREDRRTLWEALHARLNGEKERMVLESYFLLGLKPREIYAAHSGDFADQQEVYQIKANLLRRLRRDEELHNLLQYRD